MKNLAKAEYFQFIHALNNSLKDINLKKGEYEWTDKVDEAYQAGFEEGYNSLGRTILDILNGFDVLSDYNLMKMQIFEIENENNPPSQNPLDGSSNN